VEEHYVILRRSEDVPELQQTRSRGVLKRGFANLQLALPADFKIFATAREAGVAPEQAVRVEQQALKPGEAADAWRDEKTLCMARAMPMTLIKPRAAEDDAAIVQQAKAATMTWGI